MSSIRIKSLGRYTRSKQMLDILEAQLAEDSIVSAVILAPDSALEFVEHEELENEEDTADDE